MNHRSSKTSFRLGAAGAVAMVAVAAAGCANWPPKSAPPPSFYVLVGPIAPAGAARHGPTALSLHAPTLMVSAPQAAAGYDSHRIIYLRDAHQLEYFARSEWVDTPARMLAPLIVAAVEAGAGFRAVVPAPGLTAADLRLDTEVLRLQHEFVGPQSRVRFVLRATLVDNSTRRVLAWREFDQTVAAASDDPYGGVVAANRAVQAVLAQLAQFCTDGAADRPPAAPQGVAAGMPGG